MCLFLDNNTEWNRTGMEVGSIDGETIECLTNHLSTFTVVLVEANDDNSGKVYNRSEENL